jgi:imidazolonepropionase-like amidohydrolase
MVSFLMSRTIVRCNRVFTGMEDAVRRSCTLVVENGHFSYVGPTSEAPAVELTDAVIEAGNRFLMPGLIDAHTHLVFGNARSEEDVDLWATPEFRALRGLYFAQRVLAAGVTSVVVPGDGGNCSISIRDAINAGLFVGPRIAASSNVIANRHSLNDWFPEHVGTPDYMTGRLCTTRDEQIAEVRRQAKAGIDVVKIAMDGAHFREDGTHIAAFTQTEITDMVSEAHRLGKKVVTHAYGREAVLYAARAGVDVINHAFMADEECTEAMLASGCHVTPTLTFLRNNVEFSRVYQSSVESCYAAMQKRVIEIACRNLKRMRAAGVPFMSGSDSGFAVTPYGEWHARETEIFVQWLGFTPAQALRAATSVSAEAMPRGHTLGAIEAGRRADFLLVNGDPLEDISVLQRADAIAAVYIGGQLVELKPREYDAYKVSHLASQKWNDVYTRERLAAV